MLSRLLAALTYGLANTVVEATTTVLRTNHDFADWEWEMLTTPTGG